MYRPGRIARILDTNMYSIQPGSPGNCFYEGIEFDVNNVMSRIPIWILKSVVSLIHYTLHQAYNFCWYNGKSSLMKFMI